MKIYKDIPVEKAFPAKDLFLITSKNNTGHYLSFVAWESYSLQSGSRMQRLIFMDLYTGKYYRIYDYHLVGISEDSGEMIFCAEVEAVKTWEPVTQRKFYD